MSKFNALGIMRYLAVLTVRNEATFLLEWLAHHKAVGFTDFLIYSNDCDDGTDTMLNRLQEMGEVTHERNQVSGEKAVQWEALKQADKHPLVKSADWILPLDVDEFVNIHCGDHRIGDLLTALSDASAITLTWRLFGNAGVDEHEDIPVTRQFTRAAPVPCYWPWKSGMFKTFYKNDGTYGKLGIHRPRQPDRSRLDEAHWYDGSGRKLSNSYKTQKIFSNFWQKNTDLVQLNHYPLGAKRNYVLKRDRGRAVHSSHLLGMDYWVERNFNSEKDESVLSIWPDVEQELTALKSDKTLLKLHDQGNDWRHSRFETLMLEDDFRQLYGQLVMCGDTRPLSQAEANHIMNYGRKAQALAGKPARS